MIEIDAKDRTAVPVRVALEAAPVVEAKPAAGPAPEPPPGPVQPTAELTHIQPVVPERPVAAERSAVAPIVATTASGAVGIGALVFFLAARDKANQAGAADDRESYDKLVGELKDRQRMSWVLGGVAGAGAIVSAVLWYRYASAPALEVQATGSGAAVSFSGRW